MLSYDLIQLTVYGGSLAHHSGLQLSRVAARQVLTDTSKKGDVVKVTFADLKEMSNAA